MTRKLFTIALLIMLLGAVSMAQAQDKRWDGADDLPVNPLACGAAGAAAAATPDASAPAATAMAPVAYDGGAAVGAPDLAGKAINLVGRAQADRASAISMRRPRACRTLPRNSATSRSKTDGPDGWRTLTSR